MAPNAAIKGDMVKHDAPHCHAPMHPAAPVPTPLPHPPQPLPIKNGASTVKINGQPAVRMGDMSDMCKIASCIPGGPGVVAKGSMTVKIEGMAAARKGDPVLHAACVGPVPGLTGSILGPCSMDVSIGG